MAMLNDPNIVITIEPKGADKISEFLAKVGRVKAKPDNWKDYYFGDVDKLEQTNANPHPEERAKRASRRMALADAMVRRIAARCSSP